MAAVPKTKAATTRRAATTRTTKTTTRTTKTTTGSAKATRVTRASHHAERSASVAPVRGARRVRDKDETSYTDPALRERLKERIMASDKGGAKGQWSARKAQLLAAEYRREGGGYHGSKTAAAEHLDAWTAQRWTTSDGKPARRQGGTTRYLPAKAWDKLTAAEKKETNATKRAGSRAGQQFVANPPAARRARKQTTTKSRA